MVIGQLSSLSWLIAKVNADWSTSLAVLSGLLLKLSVHPDQELLPLQNFAAVTEVRPTAWIVMETTHLVRHMGALYSDAVTPPSRKKTTMVHSGHKAN